MAITQVQTIAARQTASTTGTATFTNDPIPGNLLIAVCGTVLSGVTTTMPAPWIEIVEFSRAHMYYCACPADGSQNGAITFTESGAATTCSTHLYEYSNPGFARPVVDKVVQTSTSASATSLSTGTTATTAFANEVCIGMVSGGGSIVVGSPVWTNSFANGLTGTEMVSAALIVAATGTYGSTWGTWTTSRAVHGAIATFNWVRASDAIQSPLHRRRLAIR